MDLTKFHKWYKDSSRHTRDWRDKAREEFDFYAGRQWTEEDEAYLKENERPIVTFDRVTTVVNSISGFEGSNRSEIKYIPRTLDDSGGNDLYTKAAKWARDETNADDEQSDAFKDCVISGMGWTNTEMDYTTNPDGMPTEYRVSPLEMFWDSSARKQNLADARYVMRERFIKRDEMDQLYPGKADEIIELEVDENQFSSPHDSQAAWQYNGDSYYDATENRFRVIHVQWCEKKPYYRYIDPATNQLKDLDMDDTGKFEARMDYMQSLGIEWVKQTRKVYYSAVYSGQTVLEPEKKLSCPGFSFQCVTGYRDERTGTFFGLMRLMIDPQRWSNKFFSQFMDIVSATSKGGLLAEEGATDDFRKLEESWANPNKVTHLNEGGLSKVRERQMQQFPASVDRLLQIAVQATRDVTGVNLEFLGMANRDQAGVVESERKRSTLVILSDLFNSLRRFKREQGRILLHYIHKFMRDDQLIRITGEEGVQYLPFKKDRSALQYDIIMDTAPDSPNMKQEAWQAIREILPTMMSAGMPIPRSVLKVLPIPHTMAMQWEKEIQEQMQPDPMTQQAKQLELEEKKADIEEKRSKTQLNMAKAASEGSVDTPQMQLEFERLSVERERIAVDRLQAENDLIIKRMELDVKEEENDVKREQSRTRLKEAVVKSRSGKSD